MSGADVLGESGGGKTVVRGSRATRVGLRKKKKTPARAHPQEEQEKEFPPFPEQISVCWPCQCCDDCNQTERRTRRKEHVELQQRSHHAMVANTVRCIPRAALRLPQILPPHAGRRASPVAPRPSRATSAPDHGSQV